MQKLPSEIRKYSHFYFFQQDDVPAQRARQTRSASKSDFGLQSAYNVANKQSGSESGRLQNLVGYAGSGL